MVEVAIVRHVSPTVILGVGLVRLQLLQEQQKQKVQNFAATTNNDSIY